MACKESWEVFKKTNLDNLLLAFANLQEIVMFSAEEWAKLKSTSKHATVVNICHIVCDRKNLSPPQSESIDPYACFMSPLCAWERRLKKHMKRCNHGVTPTQNWTGRCSIKCWRGLRSHTPNMPACRFSLIDDLAAEGESMQKEYCKHLGVFLLNFWFLWLINGLNRLINGLKLLLMLFFSVN